ncbi:Glutamate racemase [Frankliniella fusca]|uniref:Glutamate racemase n=1 Tax=Frankliniella fusca TaxID=407009 RepID=A0AAE1H9A7_9NEOP|nr:Glutamate racemase [Frankliniella fusca]
MNSNGSEDHFSFVSLMFDEMHIRAGIVTSKTTGEMVGFTKLSETEKQLEEMQTELVNKKYTPKLAKKVLVYLVKVQLYNRSWEVIYFLEDAGIKVITLVCDGAATNRKFFRMHEPLDKTCSIVYSTKNVKSGSSRPLFFSYLIHLIC